MRVIAIEPKLEWLQKPLLATKAMARPNLRLVHAAAASHDGEVMFTSGSAHTDHHIVRASVGGRRLQRSLTLEGRKGFSARGGGRGRVSKGHGHARGRIRAPRLPRHQASPPSPVRALKLDTLIDGLGEEADHYLRGVYIVKIDVQVHLTTPGTSE